MSEGYFIAMEGGDGSGTSTQISRLETYFQERGRKAYVTKEPTNNVIGGLIRGVLSHVWKLGPLGLQLLFYADRIHHLEHEIEPNLAKGWDVITDRYLGSTVVFGSQALDNDPTYAGKKDYWNLLMRIGELCRAPDLTIFLDLPAEESMERIQTGRPSTELFEEQKTLERVREGYRRFAREYPNVITVDARGAKDEVHSRIVKTIEDRLKF